MFLGADYLENHGLTVVRQDYRKVYRGSLAKDMTLDVIYETFDLRHPEDFTGHSLSVGDIVVISRSGNEAAYFVEPFGFKEMPDFFSGKGKEALKVLDQKPGDTERKQRMKSGREASIRI